MAIPAQNVTFLSAGPTASGQVLAPNELSNVNGGAFLGTATFVLDGSTTSAVVNFIDGTKTLSFTPTGLEAQVVGGTQNAASPIGVVASKVTDNKAGVVYLTGAGTNANTVVVLVRIVK